MNRPKMTADAADKAGTHKDLVKKARILLSEKVGAISDFGKGDNFKVIDIGKYGKAGTRKINDERLEMINSVRREIAELLGQLQGK